MTYQGIVLITAIIFITITSVFIIRYCKLLKLAQNEYEKIKDVIGGIVLTFKKRLDKQDEKITQIILELKSEQSNAESVKSHFQAFENQIRAVISTIENKPIVQEQVTNSIDVLKKEIVSISENQQNIDKKLKTIEEKIQIINSEGKKVTIVDANIPFSNLTETEHFVLQFLINEGTKSAPEVEKKIEKTREHTARLMKKLWQEGYIERDTHLIPYVYRITEKLKKIDLTKLNATTTTTNIQKQE